MGYYCLDTNRLFGSARVMLGNASHILERVNVSMVVFHLKRISMKFEPSCNVALNGSLVLIVFSC